MKSVKNQWQQYYHDVSVQNFRVNLDLPISHIKLTALSVAVVSFTVYSLVAKQRGWEFFKGLQSS